MSYFESWAYGGLRMVYSLRDSAWNFGDIWPRRGWSYGHSIECSTSVVLTFLPASTSRTLRPRDVSSQAAMPPPAPDPTTMASYVFRRSGSGGDED